MSKDGTLPPGVEAYMIPGNRPEDEDWERIAQGFYNTLTEIDWLRVENQLDIIDGAILYGINLGIKEQQLADD